MTLTITPTLLVTLIRAISEGQKIPAIKLLRNECQLGLLEAKNIVDDLEKYCGPSQKTEIVRDRVHDLEDLVAKYREITNGQAALISELRAQKYEATDKLETIGRIVNA